MSAQPEPQDRRPCCPSFVSFGCSHSGTRTRVSTGSGWSTGRSVLRIAAGFSVTYSCPARTRRVLTSGVQRFHWRASVIDVSRVILLTALGHSMSPRQCVLACDPLGRALGPACGAPLSLPPAVETDACFYTLANTCYCQTFQCLPTWWVEMASCVP